MKKFSADLVFTGEEFLEKGIVIAEDDGTILEIQDGHSGIPDDVEYHADAILSPGFINSHCHLELSHLKGQVAHGTGLDGFIRDLQSIRKAEAEEIVSAASAADSEMLQNGIVAVGDISNGISSLQIKQNSRIHYHTFIEVFGFNPESAETAFNHGKELKNKFHEKELSASITPHGPYSASDKLLKLISDEEYVAGGPLTIHMQESREENELFMFGRGKVLERLQSFKVDTSFFKETGLTSLRSTLFKLPKCNKLQLVHNTFTTEAEIDWATEHHKLLYWCFCPSANLYIENTLPSFNTFYSKKVRATIGTDSLASNDSLDMLKECRIIQDNSMIPLEEILTWATRNGAEFLGLSSKGKIEKGKKPGLNVINRVDVNGRKLKSHSAIQSLL